MHRGRLRVPASFAVHILQRSLLATRAKGPPVPTLWVVLPTPREALPIRSPWKPNSDTVPRGRFGPARHLVEDGGAGAIQPSAAAAEEIEARRHLFRAPHPRGTRYFCTKDGLRFCGDEETVHNFTSRRPPRRPPRPRPASPPFETRALLGDGALMPLPAHRGHRVPRRRLRKDHAELDRRRRGSPCARVAEREDARAHDVARPERARSRRGRPRSRARPRGGSGRSTPRAARRRGRRGCRRSHPRVTRVTRPTTTSPTAGTAGASSRSRTTHAVGTPPTASSVARPTTDACTCSPHTWQPSPAATSASEVEPVARAHNFAAPKGSAEAEAIELSARQQRVGVRATATTATTRPTRSARLPPRARAREPPPIMAIASPSLPVRAAAAAAAAAFLLLAYARRRRRNTLPR